MRTRNAFLLGGLFFAAAAVALIGSATASEFDLGLTTPDTEWPLGSDANLQVTVDPVLIGGYGKLYRKIDGNTDFVKEFDFTSASFSMTAPIPTDPACADKMCTFWYGAFEVGGAPVGRSGKIRRPIPPIEIE